MTDLCHGAKVVPNGEKYKNRFDMKKGCQKDAAAEFRVLPLPLKQRTQKRKNAAIHWYHSVLVRLSGFEPLAFRLGVDPIRHREVASNA